MKRLVAVIIAAAVLSTSTGCFGNFNLTKKVYSFNESASDNKFVQTLLMYGLMAVQVYTVAGFIDIFILNLVEFWSGSNPVSMQDGDFERQIIPYQGEDYVVEATKNKFKIYKVGEECNASYLYFNEVDQSWNMAANGEDRKLISLEEQQNGLQYRIFDNENSFTVDAQQVHSSYPFIKAKN